LLLSFLPSSCFEYINRQKNSRRGFVWTLVNKFIPAGLALLTRWRRVLVIRDSVPWAAAGAGRIAWGERGMVMSTWQFDLWRSYVRGWLSSKPQFLAYLFDVPSFPPCFWSIGPKQLKERILGVL
jgi:hypothetical protein